MRLNKVLNKFFIKEVFLELFSNKVNLFFMVLALVISLTALNTIYSLGQAVKKQVLDVLANLQFGKDAILVIAGGGKIVGISTTRTDTLKLEDVEVIKRFEFVRVVSPSARGILEVSYRDVSEKMRVEGVDLFYPVANNWYTREGRFFTLQDLESLAKVCVVGADIPKKFKKSSIVGERIKIGREYFEVIGVLEPKPSFGHFRHDERILIPITTALRRVFNKDYIDWVKILFKENTNMEVAQQAVRNLLRERHGLSENQPDDFRIITPEMVVQRFTETSRILTVFLLAISVISLVISGIIIMNLMYANVEEKAPIIALRLAIGATSESIILHYFMMAVILAFFSGIIGWILSMILTQIIYLFTPIKSYFSWTTFLLSLGFSTVTTVLFCILPATRATKIQPSILLKSL